MSKQINHKKTNEDFFLTPFGVVLFLTLITMLTAIFWVNTEAKPLSESVIEVFDFWQKGFFGLLEFTLQMMIILVLGFSLAIYKPIHDLLKRFASIPRSALQAVLFTGILTMIAGLINWGFGLIAGAVFARYVAEAQAAKKLPINPALLAASGYLGMAVWHGGLSGSATLKVAEQGHFLVEKMGVIPVSETIFSTFNLLVTSGLVLVFLLTLWLLNLSDQSQAHPVQTKPLQAISPTGRLGFGTLAGAFMLLVGIFFLLQLEEGIGSINLNTINFLLFGITLLAYKQLHRFTEAVTEGLKSAADIFIQFPFYAGILGVLTGSGLIREISLFLLENSALEFIPLITLGSSAFVNLLIPSGGGQWAIQGPILVEIGKTLDLPLGKLIMIFAYGDQISNLLQPFWALPLLAITGISALRLFRYTFWLFLSGFSFLVIAIYFFF